MKKLLFLFMCAVILLTLSSSVFAASDGWQPAAPFEVDRIPREDDVISRIFICSDTHIGAGTTEDKLNYAYSVVGQLDADAFIIAGDLTENASEKQFEALMEILRANSKELPVASGGYVATGAGDSAAVTTTLAVRGNHDLSKYYASVTGMSHDGLYYVNGVPVIGLSMEGGSTNHVYDEKYDFLKESLEKIDKSGWDGHIFLITHVSPQKTCIGSLTGSEVGESYSDEILELLAQYPQVITVSGHTHDSIYSSKFIDQSAGFTAINDGILGKDYDNDDTDYTSCGVLFDVKKDGTTEIHRLNLAKGEVIFGDEEMILDASHTAEDFIYFADSANAKNPDSYSKKSRAAAFPSSSVTELRDLGNYDSIEVTFPTVSPVSGNNHDFIDRYVVVATPVSGQGTVCTNYAKNDPHRPESARDVTKTVRVTGLDFNTDYRVEVMTMTCSDVYGEPFVVSECVNIGAPEITYPVRTYYDIDYSYGELTDAMGHESSLSPVSKPAYDEELGQQAVVIKQYVPHRYSFTAEDHAQLATAFTIEAYFYLVDNSERQDIIGLASSAGIALGVWDGTLYFFMEAPECNENMFFRQPVEANEWIHVAVTYDGRNLSFYLNGELVDSARQPGGMGRDDEESETADTMFVGGRFASNTSELYHMLSGSKINRVKIYKGTMTAEDVREAYEDAASPNVEHPFVDVAEGAWYESTVRYVYEKSLMNGSSNVTFAPAVQTNRAMIVQMLYNMEGKPAVEYKDVFTDVAEGAWYADAVIWAYENGVTTGSSAVTFSPDALVTREQVAVFLYRYMRDYKGQRMDEGADLSGYSDVTRVSSYTDFKEAVAWANAVGILGGKSNGDSVTLAPLDNAQRSETATMFARFHRKFMN